MPVEGQGHVIQAGEEDQPTTGTVPRETSPTGPVEPDEPTAPLPGTTGPEPGPLDDLTAATPITLNEQALVHGWPSTIPHGWPADPLKWNLTQHSTFDYQFWPRPGLAGIPESTEPWAWDATRFWAQPLSTSPNIDQTRTAALKSPQWDVPIKSSSGEFWHGQVYGIPYQLADNSVPPTTVWSDNRQVTLAQMLSGQTASIVNERIPYPRSSDGRPFVRTEGDPNPGLNDRHSILLDPAGGRLYETFSMRDNPLGIHGASHVGQITAWDTTRKWSETSGGGNAGKVPHLPLLPRKEEVAAGEINHMLGLIMDRYNKARTGPVRGGDGLSTAHPVRSGERLRFSTEAYARLYELNKDNRVAATMLKAGRDYGFIVMDKNSGKGDDERGQGNVAMAQDAYFDGKAFDFNLSDLEVVTW